MGGIGESPPGGHGGDSTSASGQLGPAALQAATADQGRDGERLVLEQLVQPAYGDVVGGGDAGRGQIGIGQPGLDVAGDPAPQPVVRGRLFVAEPGLQRDRDQFDDGRRRPQRLRFAELGPPPRRLPGQDGDESARAVAAVDAYADEPVGILSGGEQQRLLIAQAVLTQPKLLLLDEPLASLDLRSQHEIVHLVDCLRRERSIAVVFVAHDLNPLLEVLDSLIYILDGQPVAGPLDEVLESDLLSRLYATDVHVHRTPDGHRFVVGA